MYGIWALHHGTPVGVLNFLEEAPPPLPDCFQVLIATDEGAMWGRRCPHCSGYWRAGTPSLMQKTACSYCGKHSEAHECLSDAQRFYVEACCLLFRTVLDKKEDGRFTSTARNLLKGIELIEGDEPPPEFFVEKAKQTKFNCAVCGNRNDILGRYGYCSSCGSRNDATMFEEDIRAVRDSFNAGSQVASALKDAVDGFDTIGRNYANQLCCITRNLHDGFHSIIPTHAEPIRYHGEALARRRQNQ